MKRIWAIAWVSLGFAALAGCGSGPGSSGLTPKEECPAAYELEISPASATANHSAAPPGNQQKFTAVWPNIFATQNGCVESALEALVYPQWTSSDPLNVSVSSASDATNGTATCTGSTSGAVTLSATYTMGDVTKTGTAMLTCQ